MQTSRRRTGRPTCVPSASAFHPASGSAPAAGAFPGGRGSSIAGPRTQADLARDGLREYARYPLFGTVGIDRSYYAPLSADDLKRYAGQLPPGFPCCAKVPAMYASPVLPGSGRDSAAVPNPDFLSPEGFLADVVQPFLLHFQRPSRSVRARDPAGARRRATRSAGVRRSAWTASWRRCRARVRCRSNCATGGSSHRPTRPC